MPTTILTDLAVAKINLAAGMDLAVEITHVAIGDGNGDTYNPGYNQTGLRNERARKQIDRRHVAGDNAWRVKAEFGPETPEINVREIGFFDWQGDLIALWAGTDVQPRKTGYVTYLIDHVLTFEREVQDGVLIVNAPDDVTFDLAVTTGIAISNLQLQQLRQGDVIRAAHGTY